MWLTQTQCIKTIFSITRYGLKRTCICFNHYLKLALQALDQVYNTPSGHKQSLNEERNFYNHSIRNELRRHKLWTFLPLILNLPKLLDQILMWGAIFMWKKNFHCSRKQRHILKTYFAVSLQVTLMLITRRNSRNANYYNDMFDMTD